jgi:N-sulfoglucosamine sulfohydrolase
VKGQIYEDGYHLPLAMRWPGHIGAGRTVDDFVNARDFAPTFHAVAGLPAHPQMSGRSLFPLLTSKHSGWIDPARNVALVGKERHDLGRPHDWGYPVRAIRTREFLFVHNFEPDRWPACNPETGLSNCDDGPTKTLLVKQGGRFYDLAFGKRPEFELYEIGDDPACIHNLAAEARYAPTVRDLRTQMEKMLRDEKDPRTLGHGAIFDTYEYVGDRRKGYDEWLKSHPTKSSPGR